jgi:hypothetical protein
LQKPGCERLEKRELPSLLSMFDQAPPASPRVSWASIDLRPTGRVDGLYQLSLGSHPLYQSVVKGQVIKAPMYSTGYYGPKRKDLDATAAGAFVTPGGDFVFTGKVLGPIDASAGADYSFLVNRGGASSPGPLTIRPRILYDAEVTVTTGPGGPAGSVALLDGRGQALGTSPLPSEAVRIAGTTVRISVPGGLLPSTRQPTPRPMKVSYSYTFVPSLPGPDPADIASFVPEYIPAAVNAATPPGPRPLRRPRG